MQYGCDGSVSSKSMESDELSRHAHDRAKDTDTGNSEDGSKAAPGCENGTQSSAQNGDRKDIDTGQYRSSQANWASSCTEFHGWPMQLRQASAAPGKVTSIIVRHDLHMLMASVQLCTLFCLIYNSGSYLSQSNHVTYLLKAD